MVYYLCDHGEERHRKSDGVNDFIHRASAGIDPSSLRNPDLFTDGETAADCKSQTCFAAGEKSPTGRSSYLLRKQIPLITLSLATASFTEQHNLSHGRANNDLKNDNSTEFNGQRPLIFITSLKMHCITAQLHR